MPTKSAEERKMAAEFLGLLLKRQERVPKGWIAKLSADTDIDITTLSHIVKGRRQATMRQMVAIAGALQDRSLLPGDMQTLAASGRSPAVSNGAERVSGARSSIGPTPMPASLRGFLDARPTLHPAVKWELEQNHDFRTPDYVVKDERFWEQAAVFFAGILGLASGPYQERGADRGEAPRPRKG